MSAGQGFALHPLAAQDIADILEFIAEDTVLAARSFREEILHCLRGLVPFPR
jgi:plasmid stabilization system protein ParE